MFPPDRLVGEPPSITLVEAILKSGRELLRRGDGSAGGSAHLHSCGEIQSVAAGVGPVVEHHTWTRGTKRKHERQTTCAYTVTFSPRSDTFVLISSRHLIVTVFFCADLVQMLPLTGQSAAGYSERGGTDIL